MRGPTIIALLLALPACKRNNATYMATPLGEDMSVEPDLSVPGDDLSGFDLLKIAPDLAGSDFASAPDLANADLATPMCGDMGGCCGAMGQACCALGACGANLFCSNNTCVSCGIPGGSCCAGNTCGGGACCMGGRCVPDGKSCGVTQICRNGTCAACGALDAPCCPNYTCGPTLCCDPTLQKCVGTGTSCGTGMCMNGACGTCGGTAGACCATGTIPAAGGTMVAKPSGCSQGADVCDNDGTNPATCQSCGLNNQPCCGVNSCLDGCCVLGVCRSNNTSCQGLSGNCKAGSCADGTCGGVNQPCCADTCTAPDTRCLPVANSTDKSCQPCGGKDERCCLDPGSDPNGTSGRIPIYCEPPFVPTIDLTVNICFCR